MLQHSLWTDPLLRTICRLSGVFFFVLLCFHRLLRVKLIFSGLSHIDMDGVARMGIGESVMLFQYA